MPEERRAAGLQKLVIPGTRGGHTWKRRVRSGSNGVRKDDLPAGCVLLSDTSGVLVLVDALTDRRQSVDD